MHFKKRKRSTTKLLNKLKIDYDIAKEQYLNMTQAKTILQFTQTESYNDDSGQDDSLKKEQTIQPIRSNKVKRLLFR
jgi:ATP-dependent Clp protease ATP-binding subunit ClpC